MAIGHPLVDVFVWWGLAYLHVWPKGGGLLYQAYRPKPIFEQVDHLDIQNRLLSHLECIY